MNRSDFIELLSAELKKANVSFLTGAGISFNSGIPTVVMIVHEILKELGATEKEIQLLQQSGLPFEAYMETVLFFTDAAPLMNLFRIGQPNANHYFLAACCEQLGNPLMVTTNFDTLAEEAFTGEQAYERVTTYSPPAQNGKTPLYKIHGCISNEEKLAITLKEVAASANLANRRQMLEELTLRGEHQYILVLGYSCSDHFDINPVLEGINAPEKEIIFIQHEFEPGLFSCTPVAEQEKQNPFKQFKGWRVNINTDMLVQELAVLLGLQLQGNPARPQNWQTCITEWGTKIPGGAAQKKIILGSLLGKTGNYEAGIEQLKTGTELFREEGDLFSYNISLQNQAQTLLYSGRYAEARPLLNDCVAFFAAHGLVRPLSSSLNDLGGVCNHEGDFEQALQYFENALRLAQQHNLNDQLGNRYGNIAGAYFNLGNLEKSIDYCTKALTLAQQQGDKKLESNMLRLMPMLKQQLNQQPGEVEAGMAFGIAEKLGNRELLAGHQLTTAELAARRGDYRLAISILEQIDLSHANTHQQIHTLSKLAHQYGKLKDKTRMQEIINQLLPLITQEGVSDNDKALVLGNQAELAFLRKELSLSLSLHKEELSLIRNTRNQEHELICLFNMAECTLALGHISDMQDYLLEAEEIAARQNNLYYLKSIYNRLGDSYNRQEDDHLALEYFKKSLNIHLQTNDEDTDAIYDSLGKTYYNLYSYYLAREAWEQGLAWAEERGHTSLAAQLRKNMQALPRRAN